jgi:hypothetical protein
VIDNVTPNDPYMNVLDRIRRLALYDTRCTLLVILPVFQPLLIVTNGPYFGCYSLVCTGSAGQIPGVEVALGDNMASGSKVGPMYICRHQLLLR